MTRWTVLALVAALAGCGHGALPYHPVPDAEQQADAGPPPPEDRDGFDPAAYEGRVLVVLLASVGCDLSHRVYESLRAWAPQRPSGVELVRIDTGQSVRQTVPYYEEHPAPFAVLGDPTGAAGRSFPSRAVPTVYVYGRWGRLRYQGLWTERLERDILPALAGETRFDESHVYLEDKLGPGDPFPFRTLERFDGRGRVDTREMFDEATVFLAVFADTSCPVCRIALDWLASFLPEHRSLGLAAALIDPDEPTEERRRVYRERPPPCPVLSDPGGDLSRAVHLDAVPTFFVVASDGRVALRSQWNRVALREAVLVALGLLDDEERTPGAAEDPGSA